MTMRNDEDEEEEEPYILNIEILTVVHFMLY